MFLSLKINSCHLGFLYKAIYVFLASETTLKLPEFYTSIFNLLIKIILRNIYSVVCLRKLKTFVMLDFVKICQTLILVWENTFEIFVLIFLRFDLLPGIRTRSRFRNATNRGSESFKREWLSIPGSWAESAVLTVEKNFRVLLIPMKHLLGVKFLNTWA